MILTNEILSYSRIVIIYKYSPFEVRSHSYFDHLLRISFRDNYSIGNVEFFEDIGKLHSIKEILKKEAKSIDYTNVIDYIYSMDNLNSDIRNIISKAKLAYYFKEDTNEH